MEIICLFLPSIISLLIDMKIIYKDIDFNTKYLLFSYFIYVLINNCVLLVLSFLRGIELYLFTVRFSLKYIIVSSVIATLLPFLIKKGKNFIKDFLLLKKDNSFKNIYVIYLNRLKTLEKKYHKQILNIFLFLAIAMVLFLFDIFLRKEVYNVDEFYSLIKVGPYLFNFSYCVLLYLIIKYLPKKISIIITVLTYISTLLLFIVNYMLIRIKSAPLSVNDLLYNASEGLEFFSFVKNEITVSFVLVLIISLVLFVLIIVLRLKMDQKFKFKKVLLFLLLSLIIHSLAIISLGSYDKNDFDKYLKPRFYYSEQINSNRLLSVSGFYEYNFKSAWHFIINQIVNIDSKDKIDKDLNELNNSYITNEYSGIFKDKNLIMIMMESIDKIVLDENTMPTLYDLSKKGWNFTNRYSEKPKSGSTITTEYASLSGLFDNGNYQNKYSNYFPYAIPNMFKNNGYITNSIHENNGNFYNRKVLHKNLGFDNSFFIRDMTDNYLTFNDSQIIENDDFYNLIVSKDQKFMSFIVTMAAHAPYNDNYICNQDLVAKRSDFSCFTYLAQNTDEMIRLLLERLQADDLLNDTVLILYTDHYAYAYDFKNEDYQKNLPIDNNYHIFSIPLIIYASDINHEDFDMMFNDIDFLPTIYDLFGIEYDAHYLLGTNVFSSNHKNLLMFLDYSWYDGNIYSLNKDINLELYIDNNKYTENLLNLSELITNSNYYKNVK